MPNSDLLFQKLSSQIDIGGTALHLLHWSLEKALLDLDPDWGP